MKFLCIDCDDVMTFAERQLPGDGTLTIVFTCPSCRREMAMLTNPMETRLVSSLGVKIGGREVPEQPMELTRSNLEGARADAFSAEDLPLDGPKTAGIDAEPVVVKGVGSVTWSPGARERLDHVPRFVRGMVKRIYSEYAIEQGIETITPAIMDQARSDLGMEGM